MRLVSPRSIVLLALVLSLVLSAGDRVAGADCTMEEVAVRALTKQDSIYSTPSSRAAVANAIQALNTCRAGGVNPPAPPGPPNPPAPNPPAPVVLPPVGDFSVDAFQRDGAAMQGLLDWAGFSRALTPRAAPAIAAARRSPYEISDGGVPIGSGHLSLCWQLFSRTNCSDQQAVAMYQRNSTPIIARLQAEQLVAAGQKAEIEKKSRLFEKALASQNLDLLISSLRDDHAYLMEERRVKLLDAASALLGAAPAEPVNAGALYLRDVPSFVAMLGQKAASGERWTMDDTEKAANLAAGVGIDLTKRTAEEMTKLTVSAGVGQGVAAGQALIAMAEAACAEYAVQQVDLAILRPITAVEEHRALLASQMLSTAMRADELTRELQWRQNERDAVLRYAVP